MANPKKPKIEEISFNEVIKNAESWKHFKNGKFFTRFADDKRKKVVWLFSSFKTLMMVYGKKTKENEGIIMTVEDLEDMADGGNFGELFTSIKFEFKGFAIRDEKLYRQVLVRERMES